MGFHILAKCLADNLVRGPHEHNMDILYHWHPTPGLLPGKSHGRRSLVGCNPWGHEELDTTEQLHSHFSLSCLEKAMAPLSSVLAWRIPGMGWAGAWDLVGCCLWGRTELDMTEVT